MSKYRVLNRGDVLPASFLAALQEFVGAATANLKLTLTNATTVQVPASTGSGQASVGIGGLWRYRTTAVAAAISGGAGIKDVFVTATANVFSNSPSPDTDTTVYDFAVEVLTTGTTPTTAGVVAFRKIGEIDWDGAQATGLRQTVAHGDGTSNITPTAPIATVTPSEVRGATGQTADLAQWRIGTAAVLAKITAGGIMDAQSFRVAGTALASTHLSDSAALARLAGPTFTGTPAAPTAAVDTNTTQIATTAFVLAQAGGTTPAMDGTGAVGTSTRFSRQDHVHPSDTSRAPLASPTFTGTPIAPTPTAGDNSTKVATTAFVQNAVSSLSGGAGGIAFLGNTQTFTAGNTFTGSPHEIQAATGATVDITSTNALASAQDTRIRFKHATGGSGKTWAIGVGLGATGNTDFAIQDTTGPTVLLRMTAGTTTTLSVTGTINASAGFQVNTTPLAAVHLSNGVTGSGQVVLATSPTVSGLTHSGTLALGTTTISGTPTFSGAAAGLTAAVDTSTTQLATTAFVLGQASAAGDGTPAMNGTAARGTSTHFARADHVHPSDTSRAPLASPTFTGTPAAPTAAVDTNTTQIATTAYVVGQGYLKSATAASTYAPLASPTFTGTFTAPSLVTTSTSVKFFGTGNAGTRGAAITISNAPARPGSFDYNSYTMNQLAALVLAVVNDLKTLGLEA